MQRPEVRRGIMLLWGCRDFAVTGSESIRARDETGLDLIDG